MPENESNNIHAIFDQLLFNEIDGKNKAVHAYDSILWKVRTGFLTLIFAGFGIILTGLMKDGADFSKVEQYFFVMLIVSSGLSISAITIDINYLHCKFRVIWGLNQLLSAASTLNTNPNESNLDEIRKYLKVSGDSASKDYKRVDGYPEARNIAYLVYFIPILVLWGSWVYFLLI